MDFFRFEQELEQCCGTAPMTSCRHGVIGASILPLSGISALGVFSPRLYRKN
jgi:hypothetical protein